MFSEHLKEEAQVYCLSDQPGPTNIRIPLRCNLPGWWSKMEIFAPWNRLVRPCLYFDLDTFILDDFDDMMRESARFMMLRDFNHPDDGQSSIMMIPEETHRIWEEFSASPDRWMRIYSGGGDQAFLNKFKQGFIQDHFKGIKSYKKHCRVAPVGRIVCFHGPPKPPNIDGWAKDVWDYYTEEQQIR